MIRVLITRKNSKLVSISIKGHADYEEYGKDIVCASVSSLVISTINNIISIDDKSINVIKEDNNILINNITNNSITNKLLNNMIIYLEEICSKYPKNIKIIREEKP